MSNSLHSRLTPETISFLIRVSAGFITVWAYLTAIVVSDPVALVIGVAASMMASYPDIALTAKYRIAPGYLAVTGAYITVVVIGFLLSLIIS